MWDLQVCCDLSITGACLKRHEVFMTMKVWVPLVGATLLASTMPYAAHADEQFVVCVKDFVGCVSNYTTDCKDINTPGFYDRWGKRICIQERGYSRYGYQKLSGSTEPGGECGQWKFLFICR